MLDAARQQGPSRYLIALRNGVRDGAGCRPGGPRVANDPRGTGLPANAAFFDHGWLVAKPHITIQPLSPDLPVRKRQRREIMWKYGNDYWARHERDEAFLPPVVPLPVDAAETTAAEEEACTQPKKRARSKAAAVMPPASPSVDVKHARLSTKTVTAAAADAPQEKDQAKCPNCGAGTKRKGKQKVLSGPMKLGSFNGRTWNGKPVGEGAGTFFCKRDDQTGVGCLLDRPTGKDGKFVYPLLQR
jgi:hypothetical protein